MRTAIILAGFLCLSQYTIAQRDNAAVAAFEKMQWIVGVWSRANSKPGTSGSEQWEKISPYMLQGKGISMKGNDTLFIEKFSIVIKDSKLFYVADVPENKEPVYFRITKVTRNEFRCENPAHDFPKIITYSREGSKLRATISGNGRSIDYFFERNP